MTTLFIVMVVRFTSDRALLTDSWNIKYC